MMDGVYVNWLAVVVAAVLNIGIGFAWYSRSLFGTAWIKGMKMSASDLKPKRSTILWAIVIALVTAFVLAVFEGWLGVRTAGAGAVVGFWAWLGFVVTTEWSGVVWAKCHVKPFLIDVACSLITFLVMGAVIAAIS